MTPDQIKAVKISQKKAGLDDASYRLVLQNVGHVESCKDLDNTGFEDVMATLEDRHGDGTYWRERVAARGRIANPRQVHKIHELFNQYRAAAAARIAFTDQYKLPGLVRGHSNGATEDPARMRPWQAWNLIEALKKIIARTTGSEDTAQPQVAVNQQQV